MAVTAKWYGNAFLKAFNKEVDWDSDTVKVALCTSSYTPDQDAHDYFNDITNEVSGAGYTAGGATLTGKTLTYIGSTNTVKFDANDITWSSSTITARYAIIYVATGNAATSPLLGYVDFGENISSSNGNFTITWHENGIFTITPA